MIESGSSKNFSISASSVAATSSMSLARRRQPRPLHRLGNLANLEIITHGLIVEIINRVIIYKVYQAFELVLDTDRKNDPEVP